MVAEITKEQIARIWATADDMGMDREMLYSLVPGGSISHLTRAQAGRLIDSLNELERRQGIEPHIPRHAAEYAQDWRATEAQRDMIRALFHDLGWDKSLRRVRGFLKKYAHVDAVGDLIHRKRASAVIEALKAIRARRETHANN